MPNPVENINKRSRDGTSQLDRQQAALAPDYVSVDERSLEDLLAFALEYARELNYFDAENNANGDWCDFISAGEDLDIPGSTREYFKQAAAYVDDPHSVSAEWARRFARPHFALYLGFLRLIGQAQNQLNGFTQRHLEFYYQQILRMTRKQAEPDRVNVMFRPSPRVTEVEVPAGHLLKAGRDSAGNDLFYTTDKRIVVNHAQVAKLSSVYAERKVIGIADARDYFTGTDKDDFINMLKVALGDPLPGDPLPLYYTEEVVDYDLLMILRDLVNFCKDALFLEFFELRSLMQLKHQRDYADEEWNTINTLLLKAGRGITDKPRDFHANLVKALGGEPNFAGLTQVENIDDLYHQRTRQEVKDYISVNLSFLSFDEFVSMMQVKIKIDNEWKEINRLLEAAGQRKRKDSAYALVPDDATDFTGNFTAALNYDPEKLVNFRTVRVGSIDEYFYALTQAEAYFYTSAENLAYILGIAAKVAAETDQSEWDKVYDILAESYRAKVYDARRKQLKKIREEAVNSEKGFQDILYFALGMELETEITNSPLAQLAEYVASDKDYETLETVEIDIQSGNVEGIDWAQVYRIVELAQRNREQLPEPVALIQHWINLHAYDDTTLLQTDQDNPRWKTFGEPLVAKQDAPPSEIMGWALSSPLLNMSAGQRKIVLTLGFDPKIYNKEKIGAIFPKGEQSAGEESGPFDILISTEKDWISPDTIEVIQGDYLTLAGIRNAENTQPLNGLQFILGFSQQVDPITLPTEELELDSDSPVLKLMLRQYWDINKTTFTTRYELFEELQLSKVHINVKVGDKNLASPSGLSDGLLIQNDQTVLDAKKPFFPFGSVPITGARFYLGHTELSCKRLDSLHFNVEWMGGPGDLNTHYKNYTDPVINWVFNARISVIDKSMAIDLDTTAALFETNDASKAHIISILDVPAALYKNSPNYVYERCIEPHTNNNLLDWHRYLTWELKTPDFQHQNYPTVSAQMSVKMAADIANSTGTPPINAADYQVNPPYTPKIKKLDLHYTATLELDLSEYVPNQGMDRILHLHPFGYNEAQPKSSGGYWFLPKYASEGELYIGITGAKPPQYLNVLFQMAEGSANPDQEPVPIEWSYLSGDRWLSFSEGGIQMDTTRGLINTGIIEFKLQPVTPSTRLAPDYYWIRAVIPQHSDSVCETVAIQTQAVSATLLDKPYAADHYQQPLPENSITGLNPSIPGIAEILQPYTSLNGKPAEQDEIFYTRVSERLRHKQRALTTWDYERLVLERFPQLYKVKCLPADAASNPEQVGQLSVIVIPNILNRLPFDPFAPKAPADLITDIETYLADKIPAYANVDVRNAHFIPVKVRVGVRFREGYDTGFYKARLIEDLNHFLSPWAYQEGADITIGGRIYANSIINFLDQREYVDYVAAIKLFSIENGRPRLAQPGGAEGYFVTTEKPDGVLVASREHEIDIITGSGYEEEAFTGINYMKVELDFVVG